MLFITNKAINEPLTRDVQVGRSISFDYANNQAGQSLYFCRFNGSNDYTEIGSANLLEELRQSSAEQILVYIHGFNNQPEDDIFPRARILQELFDSQQKNLVHVLPVIWPCNDELGMIRDYQSDEDNADNSAGAFARLLGKFTGWQEKNSTDGVPSCLKRINVLAHSMGNRVFRRALERWGDSNSGVVPFLFRNSFLIAADIDNESLERGAKGDYICQSSRNVVVYFAADDLALRASKVVNDGNIFNKRTKRRLGHSGPENPDLLPRNVFMVDCDEINNRYDSPKGHAYFLRDKNEGGEPGVVFKHILKTVQTGRVDADPVTRMKVIQP